MRSLSSLFRRRSGDAASSGGAARAGLSAAGVALAAVVAAAGAWTAVSALRMPGHDEDVENRPVEVKAEGYVSSRTCQACHPSQYESWKASYHRTMTQVVSPETVATDLDGTVLEWNDVRYRFQRRGDTYFVEERSPGLDGREEVVERPVVMSTGSHTMQVYWVATDAGRRLEMVPFHYLISTGEWLPREASFLIPPGADRFGVEWNTGCIHCHATRGQPRIAPTGADTRVGEFGIACEACHGPGAEHVAANRNPARRYGLRASEDARDETIVNPAHLSKERSAEVCGRCHAYGGPRQPDFRWSGYRFRPGDELAETRQIYSIDQFQRGTKAFTRRMFWDDGMVRGSGRELGGLLDSPCYRHGEMTCLSCHSMHQSSDDERPAAEWAEDQLAPGMRTNAACNQCHPTVAAKLEQHTRHPPESAGSNCYNCHMSYTTYGLLKAIRSHEVASPSVQQSLETGRPNACSQCHLDQTLAWTADALASGWGIPSPELDEEQRTLAASVLWTLRGDAAQRALMAWSMGWEDAQRASGTEWMVPYLAELLLDPYPAVRYIAHRSLESLPGVGEVEYDLLGGERQWREARRSVLARWEERPADARMPRPQTLIDEDGALRRELFARLLAERDDRPVVVME